MFPLEEGFEVPKDKKWRPLKRNKWIKKRVQKYKTNEKVTNLLSRILSNDILCTINDYKDDVWRNLTKLYENPLLDHGDRKVIVSTGGEGVNNMPTNKNSSFSCFDPSKFIEHS